MNELGDGASAGTLEEDSGNVVELVRTQYNVSYLDTWVIAIISIE